MGYLANSAWQRPMQKRKNNSKEKQNQQSQRTKRRRYAYKKPVPQEPALGHLHRLLITP